MAEITEDAFFLESGTKLCENSVHLTYLIDLQWILNENSVKNMKMT